MATLFLAVPTLGQSWEIETKSIAPRIELLTLESRVLRKTMSLCVVLPEQKVRVEPLPVLFWLHGRGRTCRSLVDDPRALKELLKTQVVIVFPQGDDGWYIDSPVNPVDRYSTWLEEAMEVATQQYHLSTDPGQRGICGWSMGGYGAVRFATSHPGQLKAVCSIIGLLDFPRTGFPDGQGYEIPVKRFGGDQKTWDSLNPLHQSRALAGSRVMLIAADHAFDRTMNENFRDALHANEIEHRWIMLSGGHTFDVVRESIPIVIEFANSSLVRPQD